MRPLAKRDLNDLPIDGKKNVTMVLLTDRRGGMQDYVKDVTAELITRGFTVSVIGGGPEMAAKLSPGIRFLGGTTILKGIWQVLRCSKSAVVHCHDTRSSVPALFAAVLWNAQLVTTFHVSQPRGNSRLGHLFQWIFNKRVNLQVAVGGATAVAVNKPGVIVIPNGVSNVDLLRANRSKTAVVLQRLEPDKETSIAISAFVKSNLSSFGWKLVIAGSGSEELYLRNLVQEFKAEHSIEFLGWLDDPNELLVRASVFLAPCSNEAMPLSVLRSMAAGVPVIASGGGGQLELLGAFTDDCLFRPSDVNDFAKKLEILCANETLLSTLGFEQRELQRRKYSITFHVDKLLQAYQSVCRQTTK